VASISLIAQELSFPRIGQWHSACFMNVARLAWMTRPEEARLAYSREFDHETHTTRRQIMRRSQSGHAPGIELHHEHMDGAAILGLWPQIR